MSKRPWLVEVPDEWDASGRPVLWRTAFKSRFGNPHAARLSLNEPWTQRHQGWRLRNKETGEVLVWVGNVFVRDGE